MSTARSQRAVIRSKRSDTVIRVVQWLTLVGLLQVAYDEHKDKEQVRNVRQDQTPTTFFGATILRMCLCNTHAATTHYAVQNCLTQHNTVGIEQATHVQQTNATYERHIDTPRIAKTCTLRPEHTAPVVLHPCYLNIYTGHAYYRQCCSMEVVSSPVSSTN
jgi:hypothetical protein